MQRPWLRSYPPGVPAEISPAPFQSLGHLLETSARQFQDRIAYVNMGRTLTYGELDRHASAFARYLKSAIGLAPGARVALMMPNILQYPIALFGTLRAGYVVVGCNPLYTARELQHQLADSGAEAIVVVENFAHVVEMVLPAVRVRHVITTSIGEMLGGIKGTMVDFVLRNVRKVVPRWEIPGAVRFAEALARGAREAGDPVAVSPGDIAFLQYTGGTTGVAKGAMLTHGNVISNLQQAHAWIGPWVGEGRETIVTALPLYHIFALTANCLTFVRLGATNLLITNPRDIPGFVKELSRFPFSVITGVNTLFNALLNHRDFARLDFSQLKIALGGGTSVHPTVAERWHKVTGRPLIEAYGLTETSPAVTINPLNLDEFTGSIGLPLPSTDVVLRDDTGAPVPFGIPGEICVRGPQVMAGYWQRPDETANVIDETGFLRTGDIGVMNERGFIRIIDRKKDMILVSGFNVYPNEVEAVVAMHPEVVEVAAVGVPDPKTGEAVKIFVVRRDASLTAEALIAHCRENLAAYKLPHQVEFRDELPKTNVGKILRRALKVGDEDMRLKT